MVCNDNWSTFAKLTDVSFLKWFTLGTTALHIQFSLMLYGIFKCQTNVIYCIVSHKIFLYFGNNLKVSIFGYFAVYGSTSCPKFDFRFRSGLKAVLYYIQNFFATFWQQQSDLI